MVVLYYTCTMEFKYELGLIAEDKITGFKGVITGRVQYLTGCNQYLVHPKQSKEANTYPEGTWLDEGRLEVVEVNPIISIKDVESDSGVGACEQAPKK